jgi:hypothetical protein
MLNQDIMIRGKVYSSHSDTSEVCSTKPSSRTLEIKTIKENEDSHPYCPKELFIEEVVYSCWANELIMMRSQFISFFKIEKENKSVLYYLKAMTSSKNWIMLVGSRPIYKLCTWLK